MNRNIKAPLLNWLKKENYGNAKSLLVGLLCFTFLCVLIPAQGLTDDDDFYAPAGISYFNWFQDFITHPIDTASKDRVDRAFRLNKEHPPIAKWSIGFFEWLLHQKLDVLGSLDGARAGVSFLAALLAAFVFRALLAFHGSGIALFGVLAIFSLPRFLFHSQVATLDVPVSSMIVMTTIAFFWSLRSTGWAWGTGLFFGLALGTKLNAPFMAAGFVLYWALLKWRDFKLVKRHSYLQLPPLHKSFVSMLFLGPIVFLCTWPHLWHETLPRLGKYIAFHMNHYPILLFYQGTLFLEPYAPWHMPFVMALGTLPLPLLCLGGLGTFLALKSLVKVVSQGEKKLTQEDHFLSLIFIQMAIAISIVAFSHVPKYGGEKLFMPFFPLFAVLAAMGLAWCLSQLQLTHENIKSWFFTPVTIVGLSFLLLGPGFIGSYQFHGGYALSYYSQTLGGLKGATAQGYERTYYDVADKTLARWLDTNVPQNQKVHFEPNHKEYKRTYKWLKKDGVVSKGLKLSPKWETSDFIVLSHERRWRKYPQLKKKAASLTKVYEKTIDGVPLYTVYKK